MTLVAPPEGMQSAVIALQHRPLPADTGTIPFPPLPVKPVALHKSRPRMPSYNGAPTPATDPLLASTQELSAFLAEVERRAFKQAMFAVRDEHTALDVVQDAMLKLAEKYAQKPAAELPMLFQRILQNTIHDHFRRQKVRSTWGKATKRTRISTRWKLCSRDRIPTPQRIPRNSSDKRRL